MGVYTEHPSIPCRSSAQIDEIDEQYGRSAYLPVSINKNITKPSGAPVAYTKIIISIITICRQCPFTLSAQAHRGNEMCIVNQLVLVA